MIDSIAMRRLAAATLVAVALPLATPVAAAAADRPSPPSVATASQGGGSDIVGEGADAPVVTDCAGIECGGVPTKCGNACDGKDPSSYQVPNSGGFKCSSDAKTIHHKDLVSGTWVELRYSPGCRTAWTRGYNNPNSGMYTDIAGFSYRSDGTRRLSVYASGTSTPGQFYTAMLNDAGYTFKACKDRQVGGSPDWNCTAAY
ncbi:MAG TPA: DUF2690 domain-containing protein [Actinoplanes sp.]|jgi:hypothetical protein